MIASWAHGASGDIGLKMGIQGLGGIRGQSGFRVALWVLCLSALESLDLLSLKSKSYFLKLR